MLTPPASYVWRNYLWWMASTLFVVVVSVGAFNAFMDPLDVFHSPQVPGLNAKKPYLDHHREFSRFQRALHVCPNAGIFGNSRSEIGFDPLSPAFLAHGLSAFNHAIPGTGAGTTYRQIIWLQESNCFPKTVIMGVDFFDFLGGSRPGQLASLETDPVPKVNSRFLAETVFSITGLRDAISTLILQRSRYPATTTDRGFNPLFNYIPEVAQGGHYTLFRQRAEENVKNWRRKALQIRPMAGVASDDEATVNSILSRLAASGATTYVVIYPYHAQIRMLMERLGMGELFADWKRNLVEAAEQVAAKGGRVEVWDFSEVAPETLEKIPEKGDHQTKLAHYWEAGHFKKELGDLVIARVLGAKTAFGVKLDHAALDNFLAEDRRLVQAQLTTPSPLLAEVDDLLAGRAKR